MIARPVLLALLVAASAATPSVHAGDKAAAPAAALRISSDGRALEVKRTSDKEPLQVPVLDKCGDPTVGPPRIRDVRMVKGDIVATYGKHCRATIAVKTLAIECTGCD
jgi:hypothetical protein